MSKVPIRQATQAAIDQAAERLAAGELVVFPTETVYGLGGDATRETAVAAIFEAKGRPAHNPLIAHVADLHVLRQIAVVNAQAEALARAFWPGALTLVLERSASCAVAPLATAGLATIAVRIPAHETALALLRAFGGPVVAPSANVSGRVSPTRAEHVQLTNEQHVAMILDAGPCTIGLESTIVDLSGGWPQLLRPGGITKEQIETVIGAIEQGPQVSDRPSAPGQLESHYAPKARLRINAEAPGEDEAYLAFGDAPDHSGGVQLNLSPKADLSEAAANLYDFLRRLDAAGASAIAVAPIPDEGVGRAINDRLKRAAAPR